jgi:hypothetical protein
MKIVTAHLKSTSPMSQSKGILEKKNTGESHEAFEERTWPQRMHVNENGFVFIPPMAIKLCLADCAKFLSETVPGKGKATYTKHFEAGTMVVDPAVLNVKAADVTSEKLFVPSDGKKGGGSRVWKFFPFIAKWETDIEIVLLDPVLIDKPAKVQEYLEHAGKFIGLGRFRPRNGGFYGRFEVTRFK